MNPPSSPDASRPDSRRSAFWRRDYFASCEVGQMVWNVWLGFGLFLIVIVAGAVKGCRPPGEAVVIYAAQDRVFADPVFQAFTAESGIRVRPVHDNEATKTVGLANRLLVEAAHPQADLWWSNEEMHTRRLVRRGVLEPDWKVFGERRRVLVVNPQARARLPGAPTLATLTNEALRGRVALAYPVFGSTATHFLMLRQRWGEEAWQTWCRALMANRPLLADGNSVVVKWVARGELWVGLTDSDDVAFARREGLDVEAMDLPLNEGLVLPNTVARVVGSRRSEAAERLAEFLVRPDTAGRLRAVGALDPERPGGVAVSGTDAEWDRLLEDLDAGLRWLETAFVR